MFHCSHITICDVCDSPDEYLSISMYVGRYLKILIFWLIMRRCVSVVISKSVRIRVFDYTIPATYKFMCGYYENTFLWQPLLFGHALICGRYSSTRAYLTAAAAAAESLTI